MSSHPPARTVPVLLYHSVCSDPAPLMREWAQAPARFREHLAFLHDRGYTALTLSDYADRLGAPEPDLPERPVVITFDDGFADFAEHAAPALAEHGMASTLYVSTAYVGGRSTWLGPDGEQPMLSWAQIAELARAGVEIGAHAHVHRALDELPLAAADAEVTTSKARLEEHLGPVVRSFAYPHGYHTRGIKDLVRAAGYANAAGVKHALSGPGDDRFAIARIMLQGDVTTEALDRMMHGLAPAPRRERLQTKAWRTVRRARARRAAHEPVGHA